MFLKTRSLVALGDFGLVTRNHGRHNPWMKMEFGGTRIYMAPEQEGGEPCPASDQYAYATIVFEWLTGYWPFYGDARELAWQRRHLLPPSIHDLVPEIPDAVEWVVLKALDKSPNRRFKTMLDFTLGFEEACQAINKGVANKTPAIHSSGEPAIYRNGADSRRTDMHRLQRPAGVASQSEFAKQGDVLVATYLVAPRYWQSDEDFWDPMFTSDGDDFGMVLTSRWQNFWGRVRSVWERIAEYLLES